MMNPSIKTILPGIKCGYIVGGSVRDLLLGLRPVDYDIAVLGNPEHLAAKIAKMISGHLVKLGRPGDPLYRILSSAVTVDVTAAKGDGIEADLSQRDFTINAMAYDLSADLLIDPWGGRRDLSKRILRMTSETVFQKDPVRLLRAHRLAAVLGFRIDEHTEAAMAKNAFRIRSSAGERIRDELIRLFGSQHASSHLDKMSANGLLFSVIPELSVLRGCVQNRHHQYDVLAHTLKAFYCLEGILAASERRFPEPIGKIADLAGGGKALLKMALLLHDIGKPSVRTRDAAGRIHFYRHEKEGARMAGRILKRLRFSNHDIRFITTVISLHLRPLLLYGDHGKNRLTRRAVIRFFMAAEATAPWVLLHAIADFLGKKADAGAAFEAFIGLLTNRYFSTFESRRSLPPLLSGHDLIDTFGLIPSPQFSDILSRVRESRLSGRISTREDAIAMVRSILSKNR